MIRTAILVDGGFYQKRAYSLFGKKSPKERADELLSYCHRHLKTRDEYGRKCSNYLYVDTNIILHIAYWTVSAYHAE